MAKYTVSHTCGHDETHQIYGPHKDRDRKVAWLETTLCGACYHAKKEADRAAGNAAATEANQAAGLPALQGSEKQIAWAESIRKPVCEALAKFEAGLDLDPAFSEAAREEMGDAITLVVDEVRLNPSSRWWIDTGRDLDPRDVRRYVLGQVRERALAPTAAAEAAEIVAAKEREAEAAEAKERELVAALLDGYSDDGLAWDAETGVVSGSVAGRAVRFDAARGCYGELTVDGAVLRDAPTLTGRLLSFRNVRWESHHAALRLARSESLAGASVASVKKTKTDLEVTLSDGRVLAGKSERGGWGLYSLKTGPYATESLDPNHPEAERLAAEARAWAKKAGVK